MFIFYGLFLTFIMFIYSYYSVLLMFLLFELFVLLNYFLLSGSLSLFYYGSWFLVLYCCYMVLEAVMVLSFLLSNHRFFGSNYFLLW